jgi:hypothetical protein
MQKTPVRTGAAGGKFIDPISALLRKHGVIAAILFLGFVMRLRGRFLTSMSPVLRSAYTF